MWLSAKEERQLKIKKERNKKLFLRLSIQIFIKIKDKCQIYTFVIKNQK